MASTPPVTLTPHQTERWTTIEEYLVTSSVLAVWLIAGLFVDGWAHLVGIIGVGIFALGLMTLPPSPARA